MVTTTDSTTSSTQQPVNSKIWTTPQLATLAEKMALRRWNLEALTGVLGFKTLQAHQKRQAANIAAEDAAVRKQLWGEKTNTAEGDDMGDQIVLGDLTHPTPIIVNQPQQNGLGKVLAGAALAATLIGVPAAGVAGYAISQLLNKQENTTTAPTNESDVDLGLLKLKDLLSK